jgi:cell filamentation protein
VPHPWETGDLERNWQGYFIAGTGILRNRVGAQTSEALRNAENDLVEARVIELREAPNLWVSAPTI